MTTYIILDHIRKTLDQKPWYTDRRNLEVLQSDPQLCTQPIELGNALAIYAAMEIDTTFDGLKPQHLPYALRPTTARILSLWDMVGEELEGAGITSTGETNAQLAYDLGFKLVDAMVAVLTKAVGDGTWQPDDECKRESQVRMKKLDGIMAAVLRFVRMFGEHDMRKDLERMTENCAVLRGVGLPGMDLTVRKLAAIVAEEERAFGF